MRFCTPVLVLLATVATRGDAALALPGPRPLPVTNTYGRIHWVTYEMYGTEPTTAAAFSLIARTSDIVVAGPTVMKDIGPRLKADNPHITLLAYENGMYAGNNDPTDMPESWYLHTASGSRIHSAKKGETLMNPLSTASFTDEYGTVGGWAHYVAERCVADQTSYTSGCYLDMLGPAGVGTHHNEGGKAPVDPRTKKLFAAKAYMSMTGSVADVTRAALPAGATVVGNGYLNGKAYYDHASSTLNAYTDASEAEGWITRDSSRITEPQWRRTVQMVIDNRAAGSFMLVRAHCECPNPTRASVNRIFDLATYLLANTGHAFYDFNVGKGTIHAWQQWVSSLYDLNLGTPTQTHATVGKYFLKGVYQRAYSGGLVLVNPRGKSVRVALPHAYHTLGGTSTTAVTVAAHGAIILKR